ncbi:hypothetical protein MTQ01_09805 [Streptomyces sp. XM4193]|uniref:hypothetical protein n=1 Tax=Streptomyces sp. XM4193 TaxID=2929782 RepID=UPI001FF9F866|nr:hypothetical protein [Streptomyces sp. XM4193]MCK1796293.1 hypothetical protein [Streptomyces sp. XM4193]
MSTEAHTHGEDERDGAQKPRRRRLAAVSVAAAVVLAAGGTYFAQAQVGSDNSSDAPAAQREDDPEPLKLDGHGTTGEPDKSNPPSYELTGDSDSGPDRAPVYRPAKVDEKSVTDLARELGAKGEPDKRGETWVVGKGRSGPALRVSGTSEGRQGQWSFSRYSPGAEPRCGKLPQPDKPPRCPSTGAGPDTPVGSEPGDAGGDERSEGQKPVSERAARKAAEPVLRVLGLEKAELDSSTTHGALRTVTARPTLDGLAVEGWDTRLTIGSDGKLVRGHGALAPLTEGAEYPVLDAEQTLAELNRHRPVHHAEIQCVKEPCEGPKGGPAKVVDASFVLAAYSSQGKRVLVPSWSFELGAGKSVSHPAVEPEFLAKDSRTDGTSGNAGSGSQPGHPGTGKPTDPAPPGEGVEPYRSGDRELTVHFWGGACSDYGVKAEESGERVRITVTEKPRDPGGVCIKIAKAMEETVKLDAPVGDRDVVDEKGKELPRR